MHNQVWSLVIFVFVVLLRERHSTRGASVKGSMRLRKEKWQMGVSEGKHSMLMQFSVRPIARGRHSASPGTLYIYIYIHTCIHKLYKYPKELGCTPLRKPPLHNTIMFPIAR